MQLNLSSLFHFQIFKILAITFLLNMCSRKLFAQISQNGIFFQAVAKDNYDNPANRRYVFIQSSIRQVFLLYALVRGLKKAELFLN